MSNAKEKLNRFAGRAISLDGGQIRSNFVNNLAHVGKRN
jgi:hypothetical protein